MAKAKAQNRYVVTVELYVRAATEQEAEEIVEKELDWGEWASEPYISETKQETD